MLDNSSEPLEHADGFDIVIPPIVFRVAALVMGAVWVGYIGWSIYRDIKGDAALQERWSGLMEKVGKQELIVAVAPMVPDDSTEV